LLHIMAEAFVFRRANLSDSVFLSIGAREAERCHVGIGLYDAVLAKTAEQISCDNRNVEDPVSKYIEHAVREDSAAHVYYENYIVAEDGRSGDLAGCTCSFPYPEFGLSKSIPAFERGLKTTSSYTDEEADAAFERLSFLDSSFPDVEFNNTWMVESVYVHPNYRKMGLGEELVKHSMEDIRKRYEGGENRRYLITCAVGNDTAKRLYERLGFHAVGQGSSEECMKAINCTGFHVLST
jgi:ribosomal protein S18 acetylase RimI-like enzyme